MIITPNVARFLVRVAVAGCAAAMLVAAGGWGIERVRFGGTDEAALARVQRELHDRFDAVAAALADRAQHVAAAHATIRRAAADTNAAKELFRRLSDELAASRSEAGITVFDAKGSPLAWSGAVSDLPRERIEGPPALFAAVDAIGPRLVRVEALADPDHPAGPRLATIVIEQLVTAKAGVRPALVDSFLLQTSIVDVAVRAQQRSSDGRSPYAFPVRSGGGDVLVEAEVSPESLSAMRARWRARTRAVLFGLLAAALLLAIPALLESRRHARAAPDVLGGTFVLLAVLLGARLLVWLASVPFVGTSLITPLALFPTALVSAAVVWLTIDLIERARVARPRSRPRPPTAATFIGVGVAYFVVAAASTVLLLTYERALRTIASRSSLNLLQFSLHPLELERISGAFGLVLLHASAIWAAVALLRLPAVIWRVRRSAATRALAVVAAASGVAVPLPLAAGTSASAPVGPLLIAVALAGLFSTLLARPRGAARRASQAARIGALFMALLLPSLAMYPSLHAFAIASKELLVSTELALQAARQREDLQARRLPNTLEAIDAMPSLNELVSGSSEGSAPTTDRAFIVWSQTELAASRTTSAVELYGASGGLVSWFALNLPEYSSSPYRGGRCDSWELYEETSPFGASRRNVLRASRAVCDGQHRIGAIVVRAMLDYRALPFTTRESPYVESLSPARTTEGAPSHDVEFAVYGWSRTTIYASGTGVWPLADDVFDRMVASRDPFWTTATRQGISFRVYLFNDRNGIYALGYPVISPLGHAVNLGELVFLVGVLYLGLLLAATLVNALTSRTPASGRALLRELRSSFYRKLLIAFVASSVVPVIVLALATQRYFTAQFRAGVEEAAVKTATVAQRLVEDYAALQQRGASSFEGIDDQVMVLVRRAIDQDVNLFDRDRLQATSERPLFASRLLPSRTPGNVYRSIALDRLPTSVTIEEVGGLPYLLAAAPVRAGAREGIVTVPQPLRSRDIEEQSAELDRRVLSAAVLFVLLGSALGYWMAERIADPVNRLTRATRRIARGDLDARIAATSSDELRRLVEDFNRMADDLKRQRADIERTQRLEAWAAMARQVAHDIKNPLTPIQLSAEHARRINLDRGQPLSPVLDECVNAILSQVRLLRQIATEFSSFASSPTARREPANVAELIDEVVEPYRTGLTGRVTIEVSAAQGLPSVLVDKALFARALTNVIENALHAMPGGGVLTVSSSLSTDNGGAVLVEIRDTGVGMDQEALRRIFEPYFSTKTSGTGLGLTIAKRNVELSGGSIAVESERGVGTTVRIRLNPSETAAPHSESRAS